MDCGCSITGCIHCGYCRWSNYKTQDQWFNTSPIIIDTNLKQEDHYADFWKSFEHLWRHSPTRPAVWGSFHQPRLHAVGVGFIQEPVVERRAFGNTGRYAGCFAGQLFQQSGITVYGGERDDLTAQEEEEIEAQCQRFRKACLSEWCKNESHPFFKKFFETDAIFSHHFTPIQVKPFDIK